MTNAGILSSGESPIVYTVEQNKYVHSDISGNTLNIAIYIGIGIVAVALLVLVIKYKKLGILASISFMGYIALLLLTIRVIPNIEISVAGLCAIVLSVVINYIVNIIILNNLKNIEDEKLSLRKSMGTIIKMIIPVLLVFIVFTFFNNSFGIVGFWSLVVILIYNFLITNNLITGNKKNVH